MASLYQRSLPLEVESSTYELFLNQVDVVTSKMSSKNVYLIKVAYFWWEFKDFVYLQLAIWLPVIYRNFDGL